MVFYDATGQLFTVVVTGVHGLSSTLVKGVFYNAKGQRVKIQQSKGSGTITQLTTTTYEYDPNTFRVTRIRTVRTSDSKDLQDLNYWYDPVGNITYMRDDALQSVYFNGTVADPHHDYTYDALYRLIIAEGREHEGNNGVVVDNDASRMMTPAEPVSSTDTAKMRPFIPGRVS